MKLNIFFVLTLFTITLTRTAIAAPDLKIKFGDVCVNSKKISLPVKYGDYPLEHRVHKGQVLTYAVLKAKNLKTGSMALEYCKNLLPKGAWAFPEKEKLFWDHETSGWDYQSSTKQLAYQTNSGGAVDYSDTCGAPECDIKCIMQRSILDEDKKKEFIRANEAKNLFSDVISPNGKHRFFSSESKPKVIWDYQSKKTQENAIQCPGYSGIFELISWSKDGNSLWLQTNIDMDCHGLIKISKDRIECGKADSCLIYTFLNLENNSLKGLNSNCETTFELK